MEDEVLTPEVETEEVEITPEVAQEVVVEAPKAEEKAAPKVEEVTEEVEIPKEFESIVKAIEEMSVLNLNKLVKIFEKKFGVSAAATASAGPAAAAVEEKTEFDVILTSDGGNKIAVMKVVKDVLALGLKEAKDMVEALPATLKSGIKKEDADVLKKQLEDVGAKVDVK